MKINKNPMIRAALSLSLAFMAAGAAAQAKLDWASGGLELGGVSNAASGNEEKAQEYRETGGNYLSSDLNLHLGKDLKPYYLDLKVRNAALADEGYRLNAGSYGKWEIGASFDRLPHNFKTGTLILNGAGEGRLTSDTFTQQTLETLEQTRQARNNTLALMDTTGGDAAQQAIIRDTLAGMHSTAFQLERQRSALALSYNVTPDVRTWMKVNQERRSGLRPISIGTYERYAQGASGLAHTEDQFVASGMELAEPINYLTRTFNAGSGVYKRGWMVDAEYTLTDFDNGNQALMWANPFRTTDAGAKNATGGNNNAYDRGRFANGQLALTPSAQSHEISVSGSKELPYHSRFTGNMSYGVTKQNELLLPYTANSALANVNGGPSDILNASALPAARFNGEVRTFTQSYALTTKPTDLLGASLKYRYYDYGNHSDSIVFPGYAGYGESYWRAIKYDVTGPNDPRVRNDPSSYLRQTAKLAADYQVAQPVTLEVDTMWDRYDHKQQRIDATNEFGAGTGFVYKTGPGASLKGSYHYAHRAVNQYKLGDTAVNPEAVGLINYNWADRVRNRVDMRFDASPLETVSFGVSGQYQNDAYGDDARFGLKRQRNLVGGVDATYDPSGNVSFTANYSRERRNDFIQNGAKDDTFNAADGGLDEAYYANTVNPLNYWDTDIVENVNTIGLEATLRPIPEKMTLTAGYTFSESRMKFDTSNPNEGAAAMAGFAGAKLGNAVAKSWPLVVNKSHEIRVGGTHQLSKDLKVGVNYLFAWNKMEDFANTSAYLAGSSPENTTRYVMTGGTNGTYEAHVLGTYLAYKF